MSSEAFYRPLCLSLGLKTMSTVALGKSLSIVNVSFHVYIERKSIGINNGLCHLEKSTWAYERQEGQCVVYQYNKI